MKKKPLTIRGAPPISTSPLRPADPITACNICGEPSERLELYLECDDRDKASENSPRVYVGGDHPLCDRDLNNHPRLYHHVTGEPGSFPLLCGPCAYRQGDGCRHPSLRKNGGEGMLIKLAGLNAIVCSRGNGCVSPPRQAVHCPGRQERTTSK